MFLSGPVRGSVVALCIVLLAVSGCRSHKERDAKKLSPEALYKKAHKSLESYDFNAAIKSFHSEGIKAGGKDNGKPGPRADYSPTYYAAFLIDPDGNNVEAVCT